MRAPPGDLSAPRQRIRPEFPQQAAAGAESVSAIGMAVKLPRQSIGAIRGKDSGASSPLIFAEVKH